MFKEIRPDNVVMYALKHYNNPQGDNEKEFSDDMKRFKYIKRLLRKYQDSGDLKERLILKQKGKRDFIILILMNYKVGNL